MKLNLKKVGSLYRANIDGDEHKFGWYESGKAFIDDSELFFSIGDLYAFSLDDCSRCLADEVLI